jgi:flagellar capping protein FliD
MHLLKTYLKSLIISIKGMNGMLNKNEEENDIDKLFELWTKSLEKELQAFWAQFSD